MDDSDLYRVLQVDPRAETEVIEAAFYRLARKYHPDTQEVPGDTTPRMQELNGAWAVLRDPERRASYDRERILRPFDYPAALTPTPVAPVAVSVPPRRARTRRSALLGVIGGAFIMAGGAGFAGIAVQEYRREQTHVVSAAPSLETIADLTRRAQLVVGPFAGTLSYHATSGITNVERVDAHVAVQDFIAEARFSVPYDAREGQWDCGLLFRNISPSSQYRLIVTSAGHYQLDLWETDSVSTVAQGAVTGLNLDLSGYNDLRVVADGTQAFFYLNNAFIAALDIARHRVSGDIAVATALYHGDALPNREIHYERFVVLSLDEAGAVHSA